ncbi:type II toxin-antitoxin system HicB family antitoxin [Longimicrobium sp.]|uniref:type II toxin-antitoxin system HicB family antitoxin n=1 Tax=Longimicrobium sp. TaxID=2029185 RepID=UPI002E318C8B|nr:type II toxin-antitoxin system HicB family antitoxin [Longimicrobium sp.]HEX6037602.1 type II toxin-antitoxin system HicB family antitoxin [Longimicrobium sp.]
MSMTYKGYTGTMEYDSEDRIFHGRVIGVTDIISFEGTSVDELEADFRNGVDNYLRGCDRNGVEPQKPYSGKFVLRLSPEVHRDTSIAARRAGASMNNWILGAIQMRLDAEKMPPSRPEIDDRISEAAGG